MTRELGFHIPYTKIKEGPHASMSLGIRMEAAVSCKDSSSTATCKNQLMETEKQQGSLSLLETQEDNTSLPTS